MASTYKTPGVYIEEISKFPPSVAQVETAIPAFIGYTEKAIRKEADDLINVPYRIKSLLEYVEHYGTGTNETVTVTITDGRATAKVETPSSHNMFYSLQAYFANGGGPCWIVSTGLIADAGGVVSLADLQAGLAETDKVDEITLFVFPEALSMIDLAAIDDGTSTAADEFADYSALMNDALQRCNKLQDRFTIMDVPVAVDGNVMADDFRSFGVGTQFLKYGAAYTPNVETVFDYLYAEGTVTVTAGTPPSIAPDASTSTVTVDVDGAGPVDMNTLNPALTTGGSGTGGRGDAVSYNLAKAAIAAIPLVLPLSPIMAGIYASVDNTRGVWKAPANVSLNSVVRPVVKITHEDQESLNVDVTAGKSINAIRTFTGKGNLVWGARTLAGNDNEWRYISVRRFFNMVEESVKKASEQFVFEPNDANTWVKVRAMIENFLLLQWRAGALAGATPEDAFFVRVGLPETMTSLDILEGRMNVEIGMAVVRPAEFIILKFSHKMQVS